MMALRSERMTSFTSSGIREGILCAGSQRVEMRQSLWLQCRYIRLAKPLGPAGKFGPCPLGNLKSPTGFGWERDVI